MPEFLDEPTLLSRRGVLKVGLCASAFLATAGLGASLSGCSATFSARGFRVLRSTDLVFLQALVPVMLRAAFRTPPCRERQTPPCTRWTTTWLTSRQSCSS